MFTAAVLLLNGVSPRDLAAFGLYLALGLALPGVLLLRGLRGAVRGARKGAGKGGGASGRTPGEELALGVALGYAVEVPVYVAARALGEPLLVLAWPAAVYVAFLAVPRLRRHWRRPPSGGAAAPRWWSWFLALVVVCLAVWSAASLFAANALTWPRAGASLSDMPYHLALVGELRHHMPPQAPMVAGEPLLHPWFVYAHLASASWVTGVEPMVLVYRLAVLPMSAGFAVLVGAIGHRVTGSRVAAALAVAGTLLVSMPGLYGGADGPLPWDGPGPSGWGDPSQMFGALSAAAAVLVLADLLKGRGGLGAWILPAVLLAAVMGTEATHLPLLLAGLALTAAVRAVRDRRPPWAALAALGMTAACTAFAQLVLYGGVRQAGAGPVSPLGGTYLNEGHFLQTVCPYLAILSVYGFLVVMRRRERPWRRAAAVIILGLLAAYPIRVLALGAGGGTGGTDPAAGRAVHPDREKVPRGALAAGRWLRAHSRPDDLVATNAHCVWGREDPCDSRHFWVTALSERRALVEGWAYTTANIDLRRPGEPVPPLPFWDAERLRLNDAAFRRPSAAAFQYLRDRFGVRWLVVEERRTPPVGDAANLRFRAGDYAVYRIPARLR